MYIIGSGLAGCLAAIKFPNAIILESNEGPTVNHHALLRMRTDNISKMTDISFTKAEVKKYIHYDGKFHHESNPYFDTSYSLKTNGEMHQRSISSLENSVRYIPPSNFHETLLTMLSSRIKYGHKVSKIGKDFIMTDKGPMERFGPVITTAPLPVNLKATGMDSSVDFSMHSVDIFNNQFKIVGCDLNLTTYYPDVDDNLYRLSVCGNLCTIESMTPISESRCYQAFVDHGILTTMTDPTIINKRQRNGKLIPISEEDRKSTLFHMTSGLDVYSLGRFACWRQTILDDVYHDINQIERMISTHPYDRNK